MKWLASLPEDACGATHVQQDLLGLQYLSHGPDLEWVHDDSSYDSLLKGPVFHLEKEEIRFTHNGSQFKDLTNTSGDK